MRIVRTHPWNVGYKAAARIQERLARQLTFRSPRCQVQSVAGADVAYDTRSDRFYAAVVVLRLPGLEIVEQAHAVGRVKFPYIPGLLSFREAPVLIAALAKVKSEPDVLMFDGQGIAHPRGLGLGSHVGLLLDKPAIGCAKSRLVGEYGDVGPAMGDFAPLVFQGKRVGAVLRTRKGVKPVFVSPGHRMSVKAAMEIVLKTCRGFRIPEPTRQAHLLVNRLRTQGEGTSPLPVKSLPEWS